MANATRARAAGPRSHIFCTSDAAFAAPGQCQVLFMHPAAAEPAFRGTRNLKGSELPFEP